jgi:hypothetical protein
MGARVLLERLNLPVGAKVTDFAQKVVISESEKYNGEVNVKKEEVTLCMTEADEQESTAMLGERRSVEKCAGEFYDRVVANLDNN